MTQTAPWELIATETFETYDQDFWSPMTGRPGCCPDAWWDPSMVSVHNGKLELKSGPDETGRWLSGGVGAWSTVAEQLYGRIDLRVRFDKGDGVSAAILLWPAGNVSWPPEVDFYEIFSEWGDRSQMMTTTHYKDSTGAHKLVQQTATGDFSRWHNVSIRWTPDKLAYRLDGTLVQLETDPERIPNIKMWLGLQTHAHKDDQGRWPTLPAGKSSISLWVDWVKVWRYVGY